MKHLFVFNPRSLPKGKVRDTLLQRIEKKCMGLDYEIYFPHSAEDAHAKASAACAGGEEICVYAGGGDGTIRQIAQAIYTYPNAVLSAIPLGTGNDFVREFGGQKAFAELDHITNGEEHTIDLIRANDHICANMINIGFDESVVSRVNKLSSKFLVGKSIAYTIGLIIQLIKYPKEHLHITYENGEEYNAPFLLTYIANGKYCGGGYCSASEASMHDGMMDTMSVFPLSRLKFLQLVGDYKKGTLLSKEKFRPLYRFTKTTKMNLRKDTPFNVCIDGEVFSFTELNVEIIKNAIRFKAPKKESVYEAFPRTNS